MIKVSVSQRNRWYDWVSSSDYIFFDLLIYFNQFSYIFKVYNDIHGQIFR